MQMDGSVNAATVREGREEDLPSALGLIKELAVYEKCPDEVTVTLDEMRDLGFGKDKMYGLFVAEKNKVIVGIALYYYKYSTWKGRCLFLEDLIVTEKERGKGIGSRLFRKVLEKAKTERVRRVEWQVLGWNEPAIDFYKKFSASLDSEWLNGRITESGLQSL